MLLALSKNTNGTYGPTRNGRYYQPNPLHGIHSHNQHKTKWIIPENKEISVFMITESHTEDLFCHQNGCYFSIVDDAKFTLGDDGEKVAKFPTPSNNSDSWHGYPVKCDKRHNTPSEPLLDKLVKANIISKTTRKRIERSKY